MRMINAIETDPARASGMRDGHGRRIDYLRISVTDRCDLRCRYCMDEVMQFLPRREILTLEEIAIIAERFIARGIRRIRLSGGEPLVRRDFADLAYALGRHVKSGALDELTLTTNGTQLARHAEMLFEAGMRRLPLLDYCEARGFGLTLIETMPLGEVADDRSDRFLPLIEAIAPIRERHDLIPLDDRTGGPARYFALSGMQTRLGLITPLSHNFCADCNRMRLTCQGRIYMCLGHEDHVDLKAAFREQGVAGIDALLDRALATKPIAHDFSVSKGASPSTRRHMSVTGG
jgi:cyclic pyranopterin phosphate synthase